MITINDIVRATRFEFDYDDKKCISYCERIAQANGQDSAIYQSAANILKIKKELEVLA